MEEADAYLVKHKLWTIGLRTAKVFKWDAYIKKCLEAFRGVPVLMESFGYPLNAMYHFLDHAVRTYKGPRDNAYHFLTLCLARVTESRELRNIYSGGGATEKSFAAQELRRRGLMS